MNIEQIIDKVEEKHKAIFQMIDQIALINQEKVLKAFQNNKVALRHFASTTGYGYDDSGRETLCRVFSEVFGGESSIVSPNIASGTHALTLALFGVLRPKDVLLSISGMPYDTLTDVINGDDIGSLKDFGVSFKSIDLENNLFNEDDIVKSIKSLNPKVIFIQRSRGYSWRNALNIDEISKIVTTIRQHTDACIMVDNCYGEFVDKIEPLSVGADVIIGSLIKNPGGGLAPTGCYITGKKKYIDLIGYRLTAPGLGTEIGSCPSGYQSYFQGFFIAPHVTAQALKSSVLFGGVFSELGYEVLPKSTDTCGDIIRSIKFNTKEELIHFCQAVQYSSPIDSHVTPFPWDMPGYKHQVIMAAGTFVQGASIELSADSPIKEPYIAYLQGGITYEHGKIALKQCVKRIFNC